MASTQTRSSALVTVVALFLFASSWPVFAQSDIASRHVRVMEPSLAALLERGARLSVTLRSLLTELEASDVIVHVLTQRRRPYGPNGTLGFVTGVGERRYVRIGVDDRLQSSAVVALLGHELQHAVEVSRARWVVDQPSFGQLYGKIGFRACGERWHTCYETDAARATGQRVLAELRQ